MMKVVYFVEDPAGEAVMFLRSITAYASASLLSCACVVCALALQRAWLELHLGTVLRS